MKGRTLRRVLLGVVAVVVGIQLIPVWLVQSNPPVQAEPNWDSPRTRTLMQKACFDCHSNQTTWPLYSRIAPVSWLVTLDAIRGRRHFNVSEWNADAPTAGEGHPSGSQIADMIRSGKMPQSDYTLLHPDGALSDAERQQLIDGVLATFK